LGIVLPFGYNSPQKGRTAVTGTGLVLPFGYNSPQKGRTAVTGMGLVLPILLGIIFGG